MIDIWKESKILLAVIVVMFSLDLIYLSIIKKSYGEMVSSIQKNTMKINFYYAGVVYLLLVIGLYYFILKDRENTNKSKGELSQKAGVLGFIIYGVFDFTNLAVFQ